MFCGTNIAAGITCSDKEERGRKESPLITAGLEKQTFGSSLERKGRGARVLELGLEEVRAERGHPGDTEGRQPCQRFLCPNTMDI